MNDPNLEPDMLRSFLTLCKYARNAAPNLEKPSHRLRAALKVLKTQMLRPVKLKPKTYG